MTPKTEAERFVGKCQIDNFGTLFLLKVKIEQKPKLGSFFWGEDNSESFKHYLVIWAESPPLNWKVKKYVSEMPKKIYIVYIKLVFVKLYYGKLTIAAGKQMLVLKTLK